MIVVNPETPKKKCVIYLRVSSVKQTSDGSGLSSQERSCRDYAERKGYEVVEVFNDVISGRFAERPGMNALLAYCQSALKFDPLLASNIDPFVRSRPGAA